MPLQAQEAVLRDGRPALRFTGQNGRTASVEDAGGAHLTLRFNLFGPGGCRGWLYVSAAKVSWEPLEFCSKERFEVNHSDVGPTRRSGYMEGVYVQLAGKTREYAPLDDPDGKHYLLSVGMADLLERSLRDFTAAEQEFKRLTVSLRSQLRITSRPGSAQVYVGGALKGTTSADQGAFTLEDLPPGSHSLRLTATGYKDWAQTVMLTTGKVTDVEAKLTAETSGLNIETQPPAAQVYVDDVFKGLTSAEGRLVVEGLSPGTHRVRMNLIGYTESARTVELKPGETSTIEAKLEPAGPKALALVEIEEALTNGLSPKRITTLVNQFGVDFALTKELEQRLRSKGADSDLLVAIATNKK